MMQGFLPAFQIPRYAIDNLLFTGVVIIVTVIVSAFLKRALRAFLESVRNHNIIPAQLVGKTNTLNSVLFSLTDVFIYVIAMLVILSRWDVNIAPILTSAGIFGLALSFGSQTLVKDLIAGFFILAEGQYNVGDYVEIGSSKGKVVRITLRLTVLKDAKENRIFIPNSTITTVTRLKEGPITQATTDVGDSTERKKPSAVSAKKHTSSTKSIKAAPAKPSP